MDNSKKSIILLSIFIFLILLSFPAQAIPSKIETQLIQNFEQQEKVPVIVLLKEDFKNRKLFLSSSSDKSPNSLDTSDTKKLSNLLEADSLSSKIDYISTSGLWFSGSITKEELIGLTDNPNIAQIIPDRIGRTALVESVPVIKTKLLHDDVDMPLTGEGQTICVIDSGIHYEHPALGGCLGSNCKVLGGIDIVNDDDDPNDDHPVDHGTHVAGIIKSVFNKVKMHCNNANIHNKDDDNNGNNNCNNTT